MDSMSMRVKIALGGGIFLLAFASSAQNNTPDELIQLGRDGASFGQTLRQSAPQPSVAPDGTIVLPSGTATNVERFAPGYSAAAAEVLKRTDTSSEGALDAAGRQAAQRLESEESSAGEAYRALRAQTARTPNAIGGRPDSDPDFQPTANQLRESTMTAFAQQFTGCTSRIDFWKGSNETNRIPHTRTCERLSPLTGQCRATRTVDVRNLSGTSAHLSAAAVVADREETFQVPLADDASLRVLRADFQVSWRGTVGDVELTDIPTRENQWTGRIRVRFASGEICRTADGLVCDAGDAGCVCGTAPSTQAANVDVVGDIVLAQQAIAVDPSNCLQSNDGFCATRWRCDQAGPRDVNGVTVDAAMLDGFAPLYPPDTGNAPPNSNDPICWEASATYDCPFALGELCWEAPDGTTHCDTNTPENTVQNTCAALQSDPMCRPVRSDCAQGARGFQDHCYVSTDTYECTEFVSGEAWMSARRYECAGPVRCMGSECVDTTGESNGSFSKALAGMTFAQHITSDERRGPAPGGGTAVELLPGEPYSCHKTLGGITDCCIETNTGGFAEWNHLYSAQIRQGEAREKLAREPGESTGAWSRLAQPGGATAERLRETYTSMRENATAGTQDLGHTEEGIGDGGGIQPATDVYQQRAKENSSTYDQWQCTDPEFELAAKRELGNCLYIGSYCKRRVGVIGACIEKRDSYCCFASPMSRMIREQLIGGAQFAPNGAFGTPEEPRCDGVSAETLAGAKLSEGMIAEWKARNDEAGTTPTPDKPGAFAWDALTGSGSELGPRDRPDAPTRNLARVSSTDNYAAARQIQQELSAQIQGPVADPSSAGTLSLAPALYAAARPGPVVVSVRRIGMAGVVTVNYRVVSDTATAGVHFEPVAGSLRWESGETGTKTFSVTVYPAGANHAFPIRAAIELSNVSGGASLGPDATGEIELGLRN